MIYKIELEERSHEILEVEAETLSCAIKDVAELYIERIRAAGRNVVEFSIKEYNGEGAK